MNTKTDHDVTTNAPDNQENLLVMASPEFYSPQCVTKTFEIKDGARKTTAPQMARLFHYGLVPINTSQQLHNTIAYLCNCDTSFLLRCDIETNIDISQPQRRLKKDSTKNGITTVHTLKDGAKKYLPIDLDGYPLNSLHDVDIDGARDYGKLFDKIIAKELPDFANVDYTWQNSASELIKDKGTLSGHLYFYLDKAATNDQVKAYLENIEGTNQKKVFDTSLYNTTQPCYTAAPIFKNGIENPLPNGRHGFVKKALRGVAIDLALSPDGMTYTIDSSKALKSNTISTLSPARKPNNGAALHTTPVKQHKRTPFKPQSHDVKPKFSKGIKGIIDTCQALKVGEPLHKFIFWLSKEISNRYPHGLSPENHKLVFDALSKSPRCQAEPGRLETAINGEFEDTLACVKDYNLSENVAKYQEKLLDYDTTDAARWVKLEKYIALLTSNKKILIVDAPTGAGKTTAVQTLLNNPNVKSALYLCKQKVTTKQFIQKSDRNFIDYEKIKETRKKDIENLDTRFIATCTNSLTTTEKVINAVPDKLDMLIFDEFEGYVDSLFSSLYDDNARAKQFEILGDLIARSEYIILMQHGLTRNTEKALSYIGIPRDDTLRIKFTHKQASGQGINIYQHQTQAIQAICGLLEKSSKVLIPVNTLTGVNKVYHYLTTKYPDKKILSCTGSNKEDIAQATFLDNPNEVSKEYDAIIFSPVVNFGLSLENPDYENTVFIMNAKGGCTPNDAIQMIARNRCAINISGYVDSVMTFAKVTPTQAINNAIKNRRYAIEFIDKDNATGFEINPACYDLLHLAASIHCHQDNSIAVFFNDFCTELTGGLGYQITLVCGETDKVVKQDLKVASGRAKSCERYDILAAPAFVRSQYLESCQHAPLEEQFSRARYVFEETMRVSIADYPEIEIVKTEIEKSVAYDAYAKKTPIIDTAFIEYNRGRIKKEARMLSIATLSDDDAMYFQTMHIDDIKSDLLDTKIPWQNTVGLLHNFYKLFIPAIHLKLDNGVLHPIDDLPFTYQDVLNNKPFMDFVTENKDALQKTGISTFVGGAPTLQRIGYWIKELGLAPAAIRIKDNSGVKHSFKQWGALNTPTMRLNAKHNVISGLIELHKSALIEDRTSEVTTNNGLSIHDDIDDSTQALSSKSETVMPIDNTPDFRADFCSDIELIEGLETMAKMVPPTMPNKSENVMPIDKCNSPDFCGDFCSDASLVDYLETMAKPTPPTMSNKYENVMPIDKCNIKDDIAPKELDTLVECPENRVTYFPLSQGFLGTGVEKTM